MLIGPFCVMRPISVALLVLACVAVTLPVRAQERASEESGVRHVYDEEPVWEATASASVELHAPEDLTVCRQGRVVPRADHREVHMGCWPRGTASPIRLDVPAGPGFLAVRRGLDITWIGDGPTTLTSGDVLRIGIDDHLAVRVAGWVVLGLAVASVVVASVGLGTRAFANDTANVVTLAVGAAALFVGIALVLVGDGFTVSLDPQTPPHA